MENLFGLAATGIGLLAMFVLYLGSAGVVLKLFDGMLSSHRG